MTIDKILSDPGQFSKQPKKCWLVMVLKSSGSTDLRGIATQQWIAKKMLKLVKSEAFLDDQFVRAYIEISVTDHLFGSSIITIGISDSAKRLVKQIEEYDDKNSTK